MALYIPYKAIGYVTDGLPFVINQLGDQTFITLSIGRAFQVLRADKLTCSMVSQQVNDEILHIETIGHETFVAVKCSILVFDRIKHVRTYDVHSTDISGMMMIGNVILSYDKENNIKIIDTKLRVPLGEISVIQDGRISYIMHPATYMNKIVIGYDNGIMELWNIKKRSLVHTFSAHLKHFNGNKASAITCMTQSPACDVVAVGFASGDILLMNLKFDSVLFSFHHGDYSSASSLSGQVTSITFRTDAASELFPYMVSGSSDGRLYVWHLGGNIEPRKLVSIIEDAHTDAVSKVEFLHGEPVMISSSADNSVKMWIFDSSDGTSRLLRFREGHKGNSHRMRFYGGSTLVSMRDAADGMSCELLSAGSDQTFRLFNFALEAQNRELSQKPILKKLGLQKRNEKLPVITGFDFCEARKRDWADVATVHKNHSNVYLWRFKNRVITETVLKQSHWKTNTRTSHPDKSTHATSVALTACGNFCVVGTRGGVVYVYNSQSGSGRGAFPSSAAASTLSSVTALARSTTPGNVLHDLNKITGVVSTNKLALSSKDSDSSLVTGHVGEITGVFVDINNSVLVSCGIDGLIIFWDFFTHEIISYVNLKSPQLRLEGFRDGDFVAVVGNDRVVRVYDMGSKKLSRRFDGHSREVTDCVFTPDGRRVLTASIDCTVRVWDMLTAKCLSWLLFSSSITSICLSLSGEYLCVAQSDKDGIYMYVDKSLYETVHFSEEPTFPTPVGNSVIKADEDNLSQNLLQDELTEQNDVALEGTSTVISAVQSQVEVNENLEPQDQREKGAITFSTVPKAHWNTLFNLEIIKARNKPIAPPIAPVTAPFFLPTVVNKSTADGITTSFPTPSEYSTMIDKHINAVESSGVNKTSSTATSTLGKRSHSDKMEYDQNLLDDMAGMSAVWQEGEESGDEENGEIEKTWQNTDASMELSVSMQSNVSLAPSKKKSTSRVFKRRLESDLPRSKLATFLTHYFETSDNDLFPEYKHPITEYLKSLGASAVDVEFRSLCKHEDDEVGIRLVRYLVCWIKNELKTGGNYEVLQAYLHRLIIIYSETFIKHQSLSAELLELENIHEIGCQKLRQLVQSNLCLLKMLAQIPVI